MAPILVLSLPRHGAVSLTQSKDQPVVFSSWTLLDLSQPSSLSLSPMCMNTGWCMETFTWATSSSSCRPASTSSRRTSFTTKYGEPEPEALVRTDGAPLDEGVPPQAIPPVWFGDRCENIALADTKLLLTDFGVAFRPATESRFNSYTPLDIRPPEPRFEPTVPLSFASDIWSLGCTIFSLLAHRSLFDVMLATEDDVAAQWIDVLGPMPAEWWEKWEARSKYFTEAGQPVEGRSVWSLERIFEDSIQEPRRERGMATLDEEEREALFAMLRWMLAFRPGVRPSAKQVLETEWMRKWALPEGEKVLR